jgi:perosamine synthetase
MSNKTNKLRLGCTHMSDCMTNIPLALPDIRQDDIDRVSGVLHSGMLVQGRVVTAVERELTTYTGADHVCLVSNGTASLHLALIALGIGPGDEVIIPAFSYVATANVVELVGARCVFVDVGLDSFNIDFEIIERVITNRTKAIMPVHEFGLCADMTPIMDIANAHGIPVIEDAACAIGASHRGRHAGTFGSFGSFSFHPRKSVTSGEGGCLITSDPNLDRRIRVLRNHGIAPDSSPMDFVEAGFNYRMTDIQAALLQGQIERLPETLDRKRKLATHYLTAISNPKVRLPSVPEYAEHSWQTFHILLNSEAERNAMSAHLRAHGVMSNYGAQCIPVMTYYRKQYGEFAWKNFPNAYRVYTCGLAVPLYDQLTEEQVKRIIRSINSFN